MLRVEIRYLCNVHDFVGQHFAHFFLPMLPLVFVGKVDQVRSNGPHLPRDVFRRERPPAFLLVELQGNLSGSQATVADACHCPSSGRPCRANSSEIIGKCRYFLSQSCVQRWRLCPNVRVVDVLRKQYNDKLKSNPMFTANSFVLCQGVISHKTDIELKEKQKIQNDIY